MKYSLILFDILIVVRLVTINAKINDSSKRDYRLRMCFKGGKDGGVTR